MNGFSPSGSRSRSRGASRLSWCCRNAPRSGRWPDAAGVW